MGQRLKGKRALITAAGQGIGRATAIAMANEGATVFATDINMDALSTIRDQNIETLELDARNDKSVKEGVSHAAPDVLFNCAGFVHHGTILDTTHDDLDFAFDLNVRSMVRTVKAALPGMLNMVAAQSSICLQLPAPSLVRQTVSFMEQRKQRLLDSLNRLPLTT